MTVPAPSRPRCGKESTNEPGARPSNAVRDLVDRRPRTRLAARADPGRVERARRRTARRRGGTDDHRRHRQRCVLRARARRHRPVADTRGCDTPVRRRGRQDPAAAGAGHLGMGGQPPRARGDQSRQGGRPAVHAVRIVARQGLHVDGVGADGDRSGRAGRRPQRAHRRTPRIQRARRRTAARDRPADRGRAASGPAAPAVGGPRTRAREFRRAGHRGAGDRAAPAGRRHPRWHLAAARHAVVPARRRDAGGRTIRR